MEFKYGKRITAFVLVGTIVFATILLLGDFEKVFEHTGKMDLWIISILIIATLLNQLLKFLRWAYLLKKLKVRISLKDSIIIYYAGFFFTITPAKVGELMKAHFLRERCEVGLRKGIAVVFSERLNDVVALVLIALMGISSFFFHVYNVFFIFILVVALVLVIKSEKLFARVINAALVILKKKAHAKSVMGVREEIEKTLSPRVLLLTVPLSLVSWSFECIALYLFLKFFSVPVPLLSAFFIFSFSSLFGSLTALPGGIGAAEGSMFGLLVFLGVKRSIASLATIMIRLTTLWFSVGVGAVFLSWLLVDKMKHGFNFKEHNLK